jgi:V/A-type H+-transporting ATPase subunit B
MRKGAGPAQTRADHLDLAAQTVACLSRARRAREFADLVGEEALSGTDRDYLVFADRLERRLLNQRPDEARALDDTLDRCWEALATLPSRELTMMPNSLLDAHYRAAVDRGVDR